MSIVSRGASPRRSPLHTRSRGPQAPLRSCGSLAAFVRASRMWVTTAATVVIFGGARVLACPMCFGAEETSMVDGTKIGIFVLLAVTLSVQGAFAGFFFYLRRRAKRIADADIDIEWSKLQGASRT